MNKIILRLLLWANCDRHCEGCCNKDWDLDKLPICEDFTGYEEILLTGGEPMLDPHGVIKAISDIREHTQLADIYMYTADVTNLPALLEIARLLDGLTVTLHTQYDVLPFLMLDGLLHEKEMTDGLSLRLNVFRGIKVPYGYISDDWVVKDNIDWIKNCPLPEGEVFMRM